MFLGTGAHVLLAKVQSCKNILQTMHACTHGVFADVCIHTQPYQVYICVFPFYRSEFKTWIPIEYPICRHQDSSPGPLIMKRLAHQCFMSWFSGINLKWETNNIFVLWNKSLESVSQIKRVDILLSVIISCHVLR